MAKKLLKSTPKDTLAFAIQVYNEQSFIRSGDGYTKYNDQQENIVEVLDNKTKVLQLISSDAVPSQELLDQAQVIIDKFNGKFLLKKLTNDLTSFEKSVADAFVGETVSAFAVAVIASIPHMNVVDVKRQTVADKLEQLSFTSDYFGESKKRYDIAVEILDVKYIHSSSVYMITAVHGNKDVIKFWWRDQPDLSDILDGNMVQIRGTVNRHEMGRYVPVKETMLNRVKIISTTAKKG